MDNTLFEITTGLKELRSKIPVKDVQMFITDIIKNIREYELTHKNKTEKQVPEISNTEKDFIISSLNQTWNDAHTKLSGQLGDIERQNLEYTKIESKKLMEKLGG
jgi:hypothetical protein